MKREYLAELGIEDEKIEKIMAEHGKTINSIKEEKEKLESDKEKISNEKDELKNQLNERDKQLDELGEKAKNHDDLKEQIDGLKQANEEAKKSYEAKLKEQTLNYSLEKTLIQSNARNPKVVKANLDLGLINLNDDGELVGLTEQLEKLKETDGYLFNDNDSTNNNHTNNNHIPGSDKRTNKPKDVDPYEQGKLKAMERHKKEE